MTTNAAYMWLAPWQPGKQTHSLSITIAPPSAPPVAVTALRVWNYNKSADDAERGVRAATVLLDGRLVSPPGGALFRRAPGHAEFDYAQTLPLRWQPPSAVAAGSAPASGGGGGGDDDRRRRRWRRHAPLAQGYLAPLRPRGMLLRLRLLTTHGDPHYMGLDGLQLFDPSGASLAEQPGVRVHASPADVNDLPHVDSDPRTVHNLFRPQSPTLGGAGGSPPPPPPSRKAAAETWLAPWAAEEGRANELCLYFDAPVTLARPQPFRGQFEGRITAGVRPRAVE